MMNGMINHPSHMRAFAWDLWGPLSSQWSSPSEVDISSNMKIFTLCPRGIATANRGNIRAFISLISQSTAEVFLTPRPHMRRSHPPPKVQSLGLTFESFTLCPAECSNPSILSTGKLTYSHPSSLDSQQSFGRFNPTATVWRGPTN
jgi:hypothetical protein